MTDEEQTLLLIKGTITELPPDDQRKVSDCAAQLRASIQHHGQHGGLALALVGAEVQAGRLEVR